MRIPLLPSSRVLRVGAWVVCALVLQACSAVKLAYNQAPQLAYWQINNYLGLSDAQAERVRSELGDLHQWHRDTMLPRHAELLQQVQQQLPFDITPDQACRTYADIRAQIDRVLDELQPRLAGVAVQLTEAQIRTLEKKQAASNTDWRKEWLDVAPEKLAEHRYRQLLSRAEGFYGTLDAPQKQALRQFVAQSSFDAQRTYAERLRRQKDLVQVLRQVSAQPANSERSRELLRGYLERFNASPDPAYQRYAQTLVDEGCAGFARVHGVMTAAQRAKAVQAVAGYAQDFWVLAGR